MKKHIKEQSTRLRIGSRSWLCWLGFRGRYSGRSSSAGAGAGSGCWLFCRLVRSWGRLRLFVLSLLLSAGENGLEALLQLLKSIRG